MSGYGVKRGEGRTLPIVINKEYGLSINTEEDFYYAEYLMKENAPQIFAHTGVYE